ncbi:mannose-6-phosphate isomerase, class I [Glutamicibacter endophyticus]|uniref:mannose-6-phosphate isomerase, class I n=1 Tax=Glutamicibacter endophyticus TaxID=1522174 RepID=UPI003AF0ED92
MIELQNQIRDYHWGTASQITDELGLPRSITPQAELWIGAHPGSPSCSLEGVSLAELIAADPQGLLGADVAERYGRLPFLFKVLSAAQPLSIQVHPTLQQARAGYAAEQAAGVPDDAAHRNYKDDNHKPEMLYALTEFTALSGFREPAAIVSDLRLLQGDLGQGGAATCQRLIELLEGEKPLAAALDFVLTAGEPVTVMLDEMLTAIEADPTLNEVARFAEMLRISTIYPSDPGILVSLLLNLVTLQPGQAISLGAGNVHAYLRGLGIEVMANSDNVLRGGLTSKHIDVPELLKVTVATPAPAPLLEGESLGTGNRQFIPQFSEFKLQVLDGIADGEQVDLQLHGGSILLCTQGRFSIRGAAGERVVERGQSVFVPATELPLQASMLGAEPGRLFAASAQPA